MILYYKYNKKYSWKQELFLFIEIFDNLIYSYPSTSCERRKIESIAQVCKSKTKLFQFFFTSFHIKTYKFWPLQNCTNFQSNAQVRPIMRGVFFNSPEKK